VAKVWVEKLFDEPEIYILRIDDDMTRFFEAVWEIPEGITYNAYLLRTRGETILFDTCKGEYSEDFLKALSSLIDPKTITHVVVHHAEPDHSGALPKVLEANEYRAKIWCTPLTKKLLEAFYDIKGDLKSIEDKEEVKIGELKLKFICTPWLHWPDTMITYIPENGIIFGCDVGGGYSIPEDIDETKEKDIDRYFRYVTKYIVTVIGHYRKYIPENFEKLKNLGVLDNLKVLLPGHGLVWRKEPLKLLEHYAKVALGEKTKDKFLIVYDSMYGFVDKMINIAIDELKANGIEPVVYAFTDKSAPPLSDVLTDIPDSSAIIFGFSTYEAGLHPTARYLLSEIVDKANYEKPALALGSFGWAGALKRELQRLSKELKINIIEAIEVSGRPKAEDERRIRESVKKLIQLSL